MGHYWFYKKMASLFDLKDSSSIVEIKLCKKNGETLLDLAFVDNKGIHAEKYSGLVFVTSKYFF